MFRKSSLISLLMLLAVSCNTSVPTSVPVPQNLDDPTIQTQAVASMDSPVAGANLHVLQKAEGAEQTTGQVTVRFRAWKDNPAQDTEIEGVRLCNTNRGCTTLTASPQAEHLVSSEAQGSLFYTGKVPALDYQQVMVYFKRKDEHWVSVAPMQPEFQVKAFRNHLLFVSYKTQGHPRVTNVTPLTSIPQGATTFFLLDPRMDTDVTLPDGLHLQVAKHAGKKLSAFVLDAHDTGNETSTYTFYPAGPLDSPAKLSLRLDPTRTPEGFNGQRKVELIQSSFDPFHPEVPETFKVTELGGQTSGNTLNLTLQGTGEIRVRPVQSSIWDGDGKRRVLPDSQPGETPSRQATSSQACADRLSSNLNFFKNTVKSSGSLTTDVCLTLSPYVHIALVDMQRSNYQAEIYEVWRYLTATDRNLNTTEVMDLNTVQDLTPGAFVAINGAPFRGGYCLTCGAEATHPGITEFKGSWQEVDPFGLPATTLIAQGMKVTDVGGHAAVKKAESVLAFYPNTGTGIRGKQIPGSLTTPFPTSDSGGKFYAAVGSTTSIIKNGVCNLTAGAFGSQNNFSALGFGNGFLVLVSSDHTKTIDPFLLCGVFEGLGALQGATLLDGGAAAQLVYNHVLLNPPTPLQKVSYNPAQKVAYAFGVRKF